MENYPRVLVTSCRGADQGAMSVVRTLGRRGIRVSVLSDDENCLTRHSRYCEEFIYKPGFTSDLPGALEWLLRFSRKQETTPVLFPTADPDLALISALRQKLEPHFKMFLAPHDLVETLMDKIKFIDLSVQHGMPVPTTHAPKNRAELLRISKLLHYPAVLKPSNPTSWTHPEVQRVVHYQKALIVENVDQMRAYYGSIAPWSTDILMQEYIPGPDDHHYSAHVYMNRQGEPMACFTGRKVRVYPVFAGSGCYVQSVHVPELVETSLQVLRSINYQGVAVLNFKKDSRTGKFLLHEINPRVSQWNILATRCGVDVPFAAYSEAAGIPLDAMRSQTVNLQYVDLRNDLKVLRQYQKAGHWKLGAYLASLLRQRTVYQLMSFDDMKPFLKCLMQSMGRRLSRHEEARQPTHVERQQSPGQESIAVTDSQEPNRRLQYKELPAFSEERAEERTQDNVEA